MRLYPKKLRSLADLEREKQLLLKKNRQLDDEEFLPGVEGLMTKGASAGALLDILPISNPLVSQVVKVVIGRLGKKDKEPKVAPVAERRKNGKDSLIKKAAIEFVGGYLKWKAIELSFKGIKYLVKKRAEAKKEQ
jgi:hypothetical protein